jgi:hypothetical protein
LQSFFSNGFWWLKLKFFRLRWRRLGVLAHYPEAQAEVTAVFRQAGLRAATEMGASAGQMIEAVPAGAEHAA